MDIDFRLFRKYDIRGIVPWLAGENTVIARKVKKTANLAFLGTEQSYIIAKAFAEYLKPRKVFIGRDTRLSSNKLFKWFAKGLVDSGVNVVDGGVITTSMVYFASGKYNFDGAVMITASHKSKEVNGFKMVRKKAFPIGSGSGMETIKKLALKGKFSKPKTNGSITKKDITRQYVSYVLNSIDMPDVKKIKIALDASNGPIYKPLKILLPKLKCRTTKLNFNPDGNFTAHDPNPMINKNRKEISEAVPKMGADFGAIWDGDADRIMFIDEKGKPIPGDFTTALFSKYFLQKYPGSTIVYNVPSSWAVKDTIEKFGGRAIMSRTGHSFIKKKNISVDAIFAGEHSGHYYFKKTYYAENDILPLLIMLSIISKENMPLSKIIKTLGNYYTSGEINFKLENRNDVFGKIKKFYSGKAAKIYFIDGISVEFRDWHFNLRQSENDPVIRLNVETMKKSDLRTKIKEISKIIEQKR